MCHEWQQHFGHPPARHYHNMEWAEKMISVGLMPSNTGQFGGKITGSRMADYIIEDGPFARTAAEFVEAEGEVPYVDLTTARGGRPDRSKTKIHLSALRTSAMGSTELRGNLRPTKLRRRQDQIAAASGMIRGPREKLR